MRITEESAHHRFGSKSGESVCVPQTPLACRFGHPNMMPNLTTSKHRSKPMNLGFATIIYPKKYPHVFQKTPFSYTEQSEWYCTQDGLEYLAKNGLLKD